MTIIFLKHHNTKRIYKNIIVIVFSAKVKFIFNFIVCV